RSFGESCVVDGAFRIEHILKPGSHGIRPRGCPRVDELRRGPLLESTASAHRTIVSSWQKDARERHVSLALILWPDAIQIARLLRSGRNGHRPDGVRDWRASLRRLLDLPRARGARSYCVRG